MSVVTFQLSHAETLEVRGYPNNSMLKQAAQQLLNHVVLPEPFYGVHVEEVGETVQDPLNFTLSRASVSGYFEKCKMPDASLLPDFNTRLTTYIASFKVKVARDAWIRQNELIAQQKAQAERCSLALDIDGDCQIRIEWLESDQYQLSLDGKKCPVLRRLTPALVHQAGAGGS
jgi:hypothetical protein